MTKSCKESGVGSGVKVKLQTMITERKRLAQAGKSTLDIDKKIDSYKQQIEGYGLTYEVFAVSGVRPI